MTISDSNIILQACCISLGNDILCSLVAETEHFEILIKDCNQATSSSCELGTSEDWSSGTRKLRNLRCWEPLPGNNR
jgi:hypothetical protein